MALVGNPIGFVQVHTGVILVIDNIFHFELLILVLVGNPIGFVRRRP